MNTFETSFYLFRKRNLYGTPIEKFPFRKPKNVKKVRNSGRIMKEYADFGYPENAVSPLFKLQRYMIRLKILILRKVDSEWQTKD